MHESLIGDGGALFPTRRLCLTENYWNVDRMGGSVRGVARRLVGSKINAHVELLASLSPKQQMQINITETASS